MRRILACVALAGVLVAAGCSGRDTVDRDGSGENRYEAGDGTTEIFATDERAAAPEVTGETLEGTELDVADLVGDVVVINFWASWCAPCRLEAPELEEVYRARAADGVSFVGVNIRDNHDQAVAFQDSFDVTYPSLVDPAGRIALAFRDVPPNTIPATIILDRRGRVAVVLRQAVLSDELDGHLADLVAES